MSLYAVLNHKNKPIAYHERLDVVKDYYDSCDNKKYHLARVKHQKQVEDTQEYADLYLVRVAKFYVPAKYAAMTEVSVTDACDTYYRVIDTISYELEFGKLDSKTRKSLERSLAYFNQRVDDIRETPISDDDLQMMNSHYMEYHDVTDYE